MLFEHLFPCISWLQQRNGRAWWIGSVWRMASKVIFCWTAEAQREIISLFKFTVPKWCQKIWKSGSRSEDPPN